MWESQAVRLPKAFRFEVHEMEISREGDSVILGPAKTSAECWAGLRPALGTGFSEDLMADGRKQPAMPPDDPNRMFD